jgi:PPOX class probable F420-dependent enzyme
MAFPYKRIMCPIDFDDSSLEAVETAAGIARQNDGTLILVHIVPMIMQPAGMPVYVDLYKGQEEVAHRQLAEIVKTRLGGIKCESSVYNGEPAQTILSLQKKLEPDVLVMATHGRKGFSHFFLGSVAELVLRGATCPVLTVRAGRPAKRIVASAAPVKIPPSLRELIAKGPLAHLTTLNSDGGPQVTVVWVGIENEEFVIGHMAVHQKIKNIRRDTRIALSMLGDKTNAQGLREYAVVYGDARVTEGGVIELIKRLAPIYLGPKADFPPASMRNIKGYITRIAPARFSGIGPWVSKAAE